MMAAQFAQNRQPRLLSRWRHPAETVTPAPAAVVASAFSVAPSSEELPPPPPPPPPPTHAVEMTNSLVEATGTSQTPPDVFTSGNKFEPGETVPNPTTDNLPSTTPTAEETPTGGVNPTETNEVTGGGDPSPPSNDGSDGTPSDGEPSP